MAYQLYWKSRWAVQPEEFCSRRRLALAVKPRCTYQHPGCHGRVGVHIALDGSCGAADGMSAGVLEVLGFAYEAEGAGGIRG